MGRSTLETAGSLKRLECGAGDWGLGWLGTEIGRSTGGRTLDLVRGLWGTDSGRGPRGGVGLCSGTDPGRCTNSMISACCWAR